MRSTHILLAILFMTLSSAALAKSKVKNGNKNDAEDITDEEAAAFFEEADADGLTESDIDVFDLHEQRTVPDPLPTLPEKPKKFQALFISGAVVTGVGAATLLGSLVTGTMAMSLDKDIRNNCEGNECEPAYHDTLKRRDNLALTTDILIGVGSAFTAAGIVIIITAKVKEAKTHELVLSPLWGSSYAGITAKWRF